MQSIGNVMGQIGQVKLNQSGKTRQTGQPLTNQAQFGALKKDQLSRLQPRSEATLKQEALASYKKQLSSSACWDEWVVKALFRKDNSADHRAVVEQEMLNRIKRSADLAFKFIGEIREEMKTNPESKKLVSSSLLTKLLEAAESIKLATTHKDYGQPSGLPRAFEADIFPPMQEKRFWEMVIPRSTSPDTLIVLLDATLSSKKPVLKTVSAIEDRLLALIEKAKQTPRDRYEDSGYVDGGFRIVFDGYYDESKSLARGILKQLEKMQATVPDKLFEDVFAIAYPEQSKGDK